MVAPSVAVGTPPVSLWNQQHQSLTCGAPDWKMRNGAAGGNGRSDVQIGSVGTRKVTGDGWRLNGGGLRVADRPGGRRQCDGDASDLLIPFLPLSIRTSRLDIKEERKKAKRNRRSLASLSLLTVALSKM